ncbi:glycosyltransferase family 32 protein [[Eubacterium] hominis]|uniref:glycosyltransferase family 32 protein n=1 Tax=[Eubacterium] hominis TaxID=2764325 RepID=UPI003A4E135D
MIPKIIHYCWFGGNPLPELAIKCIESWKKFCPEYEIIEWNENNFDLNCCAYVKEACEAKKWAFVSDYVRLWAMVNYGGIYMDTDVEMVKPVDDYLKHEAFSGFESNHSVPTGIMACEKGFSLFLELLSDYDNRHFILENGSYDQTTNVIAITKTLVKYGLVLNNNIQTVKGFTLYPFDFFCAKSIADGCLYITENTRTVHHFSGSWHTLTEKRIMKIEQWTNIKFGDRYGKKIARIIHFPLRVLAKFKELGLKKTVLFVLKKLN